jgi:hypothetical protein
MKLIILLIILIVLWVVVFAYEMWRAPLLEEQPDGSWKTIKPAKTWRDLFKNSPHDDFYS